LGLALIEKQVPQVDEKTEKAKCRMELLESDGTRPRQAGRLYFPTSCTG
jgi:hypothetical protein